MSKQNFAQAEFLRGQANGDNQWTKLSISKLRILIAQVLGAAWKEMLQNPKIIIRSFEKVGLSLPLDGSQDKDKMHFQGCETGIPDGMQFSSSS